jgi:hypothetical protein
MPKIIMQDGTEKPVSYSKAVEIKGYMDELPGYSIADITDPAKRETVKTFIDQVVDIDMSDLPRPNAKARRMNKPAVQKVLDDTSLKGRARFTALLKAWKSHDD